MKIKLAVIFIIVLLFINQQLNGQLKVGGGSGQGTGNTVNASEVTSGGFAGDVSLFTGTYNSSYTLGTVSTNSGISYTATMTHSSTYSTGDNMPNVSGIPYGEGWNIDIPMISMSVEDYNHYSIQDAINRGPNYGDTEKYYSTETGCQDVYEEGRLFWFAPRLNIPGVASGRMVFKYFKGNTYYFVLHKFERYIEARFSGTRWEVYLDDGTIYEFDAHMVSHRSASNQRVEEPCHGGTASGFEPDEDQGHSVSNLILPKTEILAWHCTQIKHKNLVGRIGFRYEKYGAFDFHKVVKQALTENDIHSKYYSNNPNRASLRKAYKDIFLVQIGSSYERLVLDYEAIPFPGTSNLLDPNDPKVEIVDKLYAKKVVQEWDQLNSGYTGFNNWYRYKHVKHPDIVSGTSTITPTNPYVGTFSGSGGSGLELRREGIGVNGAVPFEHSFLESPRIMPDQNNMPFGDLYELETTIHTNWGNTDARDCLFDINVATGDNTVQPGGGGPVSGNNVVANDFFRTRGEAVYTTFNKALKWYNFAENNPNGQPGQAAANMVTSDFFVMPNLPSQYQGFNIQIGPANSDNDFSYNGGTQPPICDSYFERQGSAAMLTLGTGDDIPNNFGIGAPWFMMSELYANMNIFGAGLGFCQSAVDDANAVWWDDAVTQRPWQNIPTLASDAIELRNVKLIRYSKIPYMLKSARKQVFNTGTNVLDAGSLCDIESYWRNISNLKFEYKHDTAPVFNTYYKNGVINIQDQFGHERNIFLLAKIIQLPVDVEASVGVTVGETQMSFYPTTQFTYKPDNAAEEQLDGVPDQFINTNFPIIETITDPLGKVTTIKFSPWGASSNFPYGHSLYSHSLRPHERYGLEQGGVSRTYQKSSGNAIQVFEIVDKVSVEDRNGTKSWDYNYSGYTSRVDEIIPMDLQFRYDPDPSARRNGYATTTVKGPYEGSSASGPSITYTHDVSDLFWGKVKEVVTKDASGETISRSQSDYEAVIAFEPATHRATLHRNTKWDYYDYYESEFDDRPQIANIADIDNHNDGFRDWLYNNITSGIGSTEHIAWINEGDAIVAPNLICSNISPPQLQNTQYDCSNYEALNLLDQQECDRYWSECDCSNYENLDQVDRDECDRYWSEYNAWRLSQPSGSINFFRVENPDIPNSGGLYDAPDFYESRYDDFIKRQRPRYLYSFFIKKTEDRQTVYETPSPKCDGSQMDTKTTYEYYDADYRGIPQTPEAFPFVFNPGGHLYYEPSWQLFRKKTTSPQLGAGDAYTQEEYFYLYDLLNDVNFHENASVSDHRIDDNVFELFDIYHNTKLRTLAYETRVTTKAPGENAIARSTYFIYRNDFDPEDANVVYEELTTNPCSNLHDCFDSQDEESESGSNTTPGTGNGIRPDLYTREGYPCFHTSSPYVPAHYACTHEDFKSYVCDCGIAETTNDPPTPAPAPGSRNIDNLLTGNLYLSEVHTQVEEGPNMLTFSANGFDPIFPHKHLKTNEILSRNIWGQVVRERNERDIVTHYDYGEVKIYEYPYCWDGAEYTGRLYVKNTSGQPVKVTVGAGAMPTDPIRDDALITEYEYNLDHTIKSIRDPNGMMLTYTYDTYKRMSAAFRNGKEIQTITYSNWNNISGDPFKSRAFKNSVTTVNHVEDDPNPLSWSTVAYVDPLGRNVANERAGVVVEDNIYDIYDQPIMKLKPHFGTGPTIDDPNDPIGTHADFLFDTPGRSRVIQSAKYGESLSGIHKVSNNYCLVTSVSLQSALSLANQNQMPSGTTFFRTQTSDEDGKYVVEYTNAFGQKVATITNNGSYATVFFYDSHGNVKESWNPKNQKSQYDYNYLGLLYQKETVDAGIVNYGYDQSGNLVSEKLASDRTTLYEYDGYGRMIGQIDGEGTYIGNNGLEWIFNGTPGQPGTKSPNDAGIADLSGYKSILLHPMSSPEKRWFYNTYDATNEGLYSTNAIPYLQNTLTNTLGRLAQSVSYDINGNAIEYRWMSYNDDGFLSWEMMQLKQPQERLVKIDYPSYNLQGSYKIQNVDLSADGNVDFQYRYTYDNQNRIHEVFANKKIPVGSNGNRVVEYYYDDEMDVVRWKKYYDRKDDVTGQTCASVETQVDHIVYKHDNRFRLDGIASHLFNYTLFYDSNHVPLSGGVNIDNYNGNINGILATYKTNLAANGTAAEVMGGPTSYQYAYDNLNRLTLANAMVENSYNLSNQHQWGDASYTYDEIGNFTNLERWVYTGGSTDVTAESYGYTYGSGNNRLLTILDGSPGNRTFNYDLDGNIISDTKKLTNVGYGRANLPWVITSDLNGTTFGTSYLYDAADARIFKTVTNNTTGKTTSEYYIRSASGQELAVYNLSEDKITWYIYGNERVAKIHQKSNVEFEEPQMGPCDPNPPVCDAAMLAQQQAALPGIRTNMASRNTSNVGIPSTLYRIRLCDGTELHLLGDELSLLPGTFMTLQIIRIESAGQLFATAGNGLASIVDLAGLLQARVNDENVYIDGYEPCILDNLCNDGAQIYPAHSVGASTIFSSYYNDPPYDDMTVVWANAGKSLVGDNDYWLTSSQYLTKQEAEWDVSYDFSSINTTNIQINSYKVHIDYWTGCTGNERLELGLFDGQNLISINGGYFRLSLDCLLPEGRLTITPDQAVSMDQIQNMRLAIYRSDRTLDRVLIDLVEAELDYSYFCPCQAPSPTCYAGGSFNQSNSLTNLENSMTTTQLGNIALPTNMYRVKYCDGRELNVLRQEMSFVDGAGRIMQKLKVNDASQLFSVEQGGVPMTVSFGQLIELRKTDKDIEVSTPCDPGDDTPPEDDDGPLDGDIYFYVNDHLGNTRVLYHTEFDCENPGISYIFDHVVDYYPYGKVLREYVNGEEEKFLTTHHERDQETELDYRGARFYDADIGRFLSLDPLAYIAPEWNAYRYAKDNPLLFIDPDGLYEWRINSATGDYEKIGEKGGDEEQFIYWDNAETPAKSLKGSTIYVGVISTDWFDDSATAIGVSTKDYWSDIPESHIGEYTMGALIERYEALQIGGMKYNSIVQLEAYRKEDGSILKRREMIWNTSDYAAYLSEKYGSTAGYIVAFDTEIVNLMIPGGSQSNLLRQQLKTLKNLKNVNPNKKFNGSQRASSKSKSPTGSSNKGKDGKANNSWNEFLKSNRGKYKGKDWLKRAVNDYNTLKKAGKI